MTHSDREKRVQSVWPDGPETESPLSIVDIEENPKGLLSWDLETKLQTASPMRIRHYLTLYAAGEENVGAKVAPRTK